MKEVRYFFVPDAANQSELPSDEAMHALRVLRLKAGDEMFLMDGVGCYYRAQVTIAATQHCHYEILEQLPQERPWEGLVHLAIAPTKMMDRIEWLSEKATEIGVDEISFINTKFSERKLVKIPRLDKIVVSAVKQSRKAWKPQLNEIVSLKDFIRKHQEGRRYIAHCYDEIPREDLYTLLDKAVPEEDATLLIGPEGDFSTEEIILCKSLNYKEIKLGSRRLRTETAALYGCFTIAAKNN